MRKFLLLVCTVTLFVACSASGGTPPSFSAGAHRTTTTDEFDVPSSVPSPLPHSTTTLSPPSPGSTCRQNYLPDKRCTPGALNPAVTQASIGSTICVSGYTKTIRPPVSESNRLKNLAAQNYGINPFDPTQYEGDHLISLELGGAPDDISNFWDEPHSANGSDGQPAGSAVKDGFENYLKKQVCTGTLTLSQAQEEISTDWYSYFVQAGRPKSTFGTQTGN